MNDGLLESAFDVAGDRQFVASRHSLEKDRDLVAVSFVLLKGTAADDDPLAGDLRPRVPAVRMGRDLEPESHDRHRRDAGAAVAANARSGDVRHPAAGVGVQFDGEVRGGTRMAAVFNGVAHGTDPSERRRYGQ